MSVSSTSSATCEPSIGGEPEMGWILRRDTHGQGYGLEACSAALDWFNSNLQRAVDPGDHLAAREICRRCGWRSGSASSGEPDATYRDEPIRPVPPPGLG